MLKQQHEERLAMVADGLITVADAEIITGLKKSTLYQLMATGQLPYAKIGSARRIPRKALLEFMAGSLVIREDC